MRTSFHHQPEAQHLILQLSTSWQADYPIFRGEAGIQGRLEMFYPSEISGPGSDGEFLDQNRGFHPAG